MYASFFRTINDYTQQSLKQWQKIGETGFGIAGNLLQTQIELAANLADIAAYHAGSIFAAKDASEIASRQAGMVEESGKILIETVHSTSEILAEAGKAYGEIFETSLENSGAVSNTANTSKAQKNVA